MPQTKSSNCQLKCEHKNTTFLPIKELQRPTKIPHLTIERTKEDSDWIHNSITRADLLQISSKMEAYYSLIMDSSYCVYHMECSGQFWRWQTSAITKQYSKIIISLHFSMDHATSNSLILLSYNDHNSHPYLLLQ